MSAAMVGGVPPPLETAVGGLGIAALGVGADVVANGAVGGGTVLELVTALLLWLVLRELQKGKGRS